MSEYAKYFTLRHKQEFVLPSFDDDEPVTESFMPFIRFDEPWTLYERLKTGVFVFGFILPIKIVIMILGWILAWICALLGNIGFDSTNENELTKTVPMWRKFWFNLSRFFGASFGLFFCSFYTIKRTKLTYDDILYNGKNNKNNKNGINYRLDYENDDFLRSMYENYICKNIEPPCYTIVSNHQGHSDILSLLYFYAGSFVAQFHVSQAPLLGTICGALYALWVKKGVGVAQALKNRMELTYNMHVDTQNGYKLKNNCDGCSLCTSNLVVFAEGTTTNCSCLLAFRTGVFNAGLPVKPIVFRFPWKCVNSCWESSFYDNLVFRLSTQFTNRMEIIECPPYLPNKYERNDPSLYAFNVSLFMAKIMEYDTNFDKKNNNQDYPCTKLMKQRIKYLDKVNPNLRQIYQNKLNENKLHCPIYLLNRNYKTGAYHKFVVLGWSSFMIRSVCRSFAKDETIEKHKQWNEKYVEYLEYLQQNSSQ